MRRKRGAILPVVLFVVLLIGMLAAVFAFRVHADVASTQVVGDQLQARLAAEAGVEWVKLILRDGRLDRSVWYSNPDAFHRVVVWAMGADSTSSGTTEEYGEDVGYRFSIVADDPADDETYIRFGLTDEASKLNLNTATEGELLALVTHALVGRDDVVPQDLVNAILDWRDTDSEPRGEAADTEREYYRTLSKPYRVKNGPFDSVEELLLVKGITPSILYGEDFDGNGLLTDNEDDGDFTFPPDNQDNLLNRGLYPYLTTMSYESNVSDGNRPRVYLKGPQAQVRAELEMAFPDSPEVVDFVINAFKKKAGQGGQGGAGQGGGGDGDQGGQQGGDGAQNPRGGDNQGGGPRGGQGGQGGNRPGSGNPPNPNPSRVPVPPGTKKIGGGPNPPPPPPPSTGKSQASEKDKLTPQMQVRPPSGNQPSRGPKPPPNAGNQPSRRGDNQPGGGNPPVEPGEPLEPPGGEEQNPQNPDDPGQGDPGEGQQEEDASGEDGPPGDGGQEGSGDGEGETRPIRSPADLMLLQPEEGPNPLTIEDLAILMDRTSMENAKKRNKVININTAPRPVLECIEALEPEQVDGILEAREKLSDAKLRSPTWLVAEGILPMETFAEIAPNITTRGQQFSVESLGYADHKGMIARLQVVLDLVGPIPQVIYYRDISYMGAPFPIREEDLEQQRGR